MQNMIKVEDEHLTFMLEQTEQNICILGLPAFRNYLIEFHLNGDLKIYHSKSK